MPLADIGQYEGSLQYRLISHELHGRDNVDNSSRENNTANIENLSILN
jgi:hypothetical protein